MSPPARGRGGAGRGGARTRGTCGTRRGGARGVPETKAAGAGTPCPRQWDGVHLGTREHPAGRGQAGTERRRSTALATAGRRAEGPRGPAQRAHREARFDPSETAGWLFLRRARARGGSPRFCLFFPQKGGDCLQRPWEAPSGSREHETLRSKGSPPRVAT